MAGLNIDLLVRLVERDLEHSQSRVRAYKLVSIFYGKPPAFSSNSPSPPQGVLYIDGIWLSPRHLTDTNKTFKYMRWKTSGKESDYVPRVDIVFFRSAKLYCSTNYPSSGKVKFELLSLR